MEAKDTVMSKEEQTKINSDMPSDAKYGEVFQSIAKAQAEITGRIMKQEGIKEMVEWVKEYDRLNNLFLYTPRTFKEKWQAQLKKWGIDREVKDE